MRKLLLLFFGLYAAVGFAQQSTADTAPLEIKKISSEGILLNNGWKFQAGDNPAYAEPDYDDSQWQDIDPTRDVHDLLPQLKKTGIGWFRLSLAFDSSLLKQPMTFVIQQSGASELYLNAQLLFQFGVVAADPQKIKAFDPLLNPVLFSASANTQQVLAIRYALEPNVLYTKMFETVNPAFAITIQEPGAAFSEYRENSLRVQRMIMLIAGVCLMLFILHMSFYFFYREQKANLYIALFAIVYLIGNLVQLAFYFNKTVAAKFYLANLSMGLFEVAFMFLLTSLHYLTQQRKDTVYWLLLAYAGVSLVLNTWPYDVGWKVGGAVTLLLIRLNIIRIGFIAVLKKMNGALFIAIGGVCSMLFFIFFVSQGTFTGSSFISAFVQRRASFYFLSNLSIPVATSIYLALEFAFVNRLLRQKLAEVEDLSQRTITQEQEKQQILAKQKDSLEKEVAQRTAELKSSLEELKSTQTQLIQKEKMASLGELTAGIAHEIRNPLNFVNNFSAVNKELIAELKQEAQSGNIEEVFSLAKSIEDNEEKISHHGKRADTIVKNMLEHSRGTTGEKELTDINALVDEYLRLAYHGYRAKDKTFDADFSTQYNTSLNRVNIVPQEIGRVLLNLLNNAFYAVGEKKKRLNGTYEPLVSVATKKEGEHITITVKDNGMGMTPKVAEKVFQPFFTTKPTGEGTGLGLSLSYDIITKGHGGELKVKTKEGEGSEFIVQLPLQS